MFLFDYKNIINVIQEPITWIQTTIFIYGIILILSSIIIYFNKDLNKFINITGITLILIIFNFNIQLKQYYICKTNIISFLIENYKNIFILDKNSIIFIFLTILIIPLLFFTYELSFGFNVFKFNPKINIYTLNNIFSLKLKQTTNLKLYLVLMNIIILLLLYIFMCNNILIFFILYEAIIIPIVLLIYKWGPRKEGKKAIFYFILYSLISSILMIYGILIIYNYYNTFNIFILTNIFITEKLQYLIFLLFFIPFAVKIPILPFHLWLPEAHVEAPTGGSILLAALLLKLGVFGFIKIQLSLVPIACYYFFPLITIFTLISVIYTSFIIFRQLDIKKIIAYSSIIHMNTIILALFCSNKYGIEGAIFYMLSHGLVSSGLFAVIGILYRINHTRIINLYGGNLKFSPILAFFFLLFILANFSFPGTSNFAGEIILLIGLFQQNIILGFIVFISLLLAPLYSILLFNRIFFGNSKQILNLKQKNNSDIYKIDQDLNILEFYNLTYILCLIIIFGLFPNIIYNLIML